MKAELTQQRSLLELAELDAEIARTAHREANLAEQAVLLDAQADHREAENALTSLQLALADLDSRAAKFETEIDGVRQREDRDRGLLAGGTVDAKQLTELQHELETLQRRRTSLEDSLLEVMQTREDLSTRTDLAQSRVEELRMNVDDALRGRDTARGDLAQVQQQAQIRRTELVSRLDGALLELYEKQRARGGVGAGLLQGRRCGACRLEIDKGGLARIAAAADDDVLRCPECSAILLRVRGFTA